MNDPSSPDYWKRSLIATASLAILSLGTIGGASTLALADTPESGPPQSAVAADSSEVLEEIVITARKRTEDLQTVPVAVTALQAGTLDREGIRDIVDLARQVPSLTMSGPTAATSTGSLISLRGQMASDVLLSVSQPVGLYEDGANIPHPVGSNLGFFDLDRVEVLKGPQGTLYGRNTTGGAINIITRNANYDGEHGFAYVEAGEYNDRKVTAAFNMPIVEDALAARLSYQHWERNGYGESLITGERFGGDHDDDDVRLSLRFDPTSNVSGNFKIERFLANRSDALYQMRALFPGNGNPPNQVGANLLDAEWAAEGAVGAIPPSTLVNSYSNLFQNYSDVVTFEHLTGWHGVNDVTWDISDSVRLRSITGYHQFIDFRTFDLAALPVAASEVGVGLGGLSLPSGIVNLGALTGIGALPTVAAAGSNLLPLKPDEESRQWTQEFNLAGDAFDAHLQWLGGAFYSNDVGVEDESVAALPVLGSVTAGNLAALFAPGAALTLPESVAADYDQLSNTIRTGAVFTQDDIKFNDWFSITVGGRYTEEKLGQQIAVFSYDASDLPVPAGRYVCSAGPNSGISQQTETGCELGQAATFTGASYLGSLNFQLAPDRLLYAKTSRGFRGGALQVRAPTYPAAKPEIATDYELGFKSDFLNHHLRTNLAAYQTNYDNKQETAIVIQNGIPITPIVNASKTRIRGFESEITYLPFKDLSLAASYTYFDGIYLSFPNAPLFYGGTVNARNVPMPTEFKHRFNLDARYTVHGIGPGDLSVDANYFWRSTLPTTVLNNYAPILPLSVQNSWDESLGLLNGSADYSLPHALVIALSSTNVLNRHYQVIGEPLPVGFTGVTEEPRMWWISVRKAFGRE